MEKEKKNKKDGTIISAKITKTFRGIIGEYLLADAHLTVSDLIRDAVREKIQHDAPELYRRMFERNGAKEVKKRSN